MKLIFLTIILFFTIFSFTSCNNVKEKKIEVAETETEYKTTMHERVHTLTGEKRQELLMTYYRKVNQSASKSKIVPEIRANRYNVAHHYPQTGKDVYMDGLKIWCANYPDEVADYILYLDSVVNNN